MERLPGKNRIPECASAVEPVHPTAGKRNASTAETEGTGLGYHSLVVEAAWQFQLERMRRQLRTCETQR